MHRKACGRIRSELGLVSGCAASLQRFAGGIGGKTKEVQAPLEREKEYNCDCLQLHTTVPQNSFVSCEFVFAMRLPLCNDLLLSYAMLHMFAPP